MKKNITITLIALGLSTGLYADKLTYEVTQEEAINQLQKVVKKIISNEAENSIKEEQRNKKLETLKNRINTLEIKLGHLEKKGTSQKKKINVERNIQLDEKIINYINEK